jgi:hypothetical protein
MVKRAMVMVSVSVFVFGQQSKVNFLEPQAIGEQKNGETLYSKNTLRVLLD